jgi:hypothetical protein
MGLVVEEPSPSPSKKGGDSDREIHTDARHFGDGVCEKGVLEILGRCIKSGLRRCPEGESIAMLVGREKG